MKFKVLTLVAMVAVFAVGCATKMDQNIAAVDQQTQKAAVAYQETKGQTAGIGEYQMSRISGDEIFLGENNVDDPLFSKNFTYYTKGVQTLSQVLNNLSRIIGKPVLAREVAVGEIVASATPQSNPLEGVVDIEFRGPLRSLLDKIGEQNDISWRYKEGRIEFYKYESRVFHMSLPGGTKNVESSISLSGVSSGSSGSSDSGSSGGSSAGGGNVSVSSEMEISPWNSVLKGISSILMSESLGAAGGESESSSLATTGRYGYAVANPDLGIITVTARPTYLDRVETYVESINKRFAQNILIDIRVFSVSLGDELSAGFSLESVINQVNFSGYGLRLDQLAVAGPAILAPISGTQPGNISVDTSFFSKNFQGQADMVLQALKGVGKASLQTQGQVLAINGQPAPFQVASETSYISSSSQTQSDVGITSSVETETRVTGFTANFVPMILGDNRILLQYQMQISSLDNMLSVTQGDGSIIQLPQVSSQTLQQQSFMHDGQTLMLFSFAQDKNRSGSNFGPFAISKSASQDKQLLVIMLHIRSTGNSPLSHEVSSLGGHALPIDGMLWTLAV
jgi:type IVB pilus formation R64 PilN family outer membrane protein